MATSNNFDQATQQLESMFLGPARAYAAMTVDYTEKVLNTQLDFAKACTDTYLGQARSMLDVRDAEGLRNYVQQQQKTAKDLGERFKDDAEKVVALNQDFAQKSQKLVEDNIQTASKTAASKTK
ncbi:MULTISPECIES: phasin family protein [Halomonadaceae]|uniref:Phasin domain-containing protein n=1 Tax=Modicisalibacter zincidurans TaxID=1178777 RepID=A0ABP9RM44_9GAMM|nr:MULTISPECIES: phasin family protein [Halomonas]MCD6009692.1 phasin family protein [Halomonas sp. IOP_31]